MTWDEAVQEFMEHILPLVREQYEQDGIPDIPARREAWNNWTDMLCKDGTTHLAMSINKNGGKQRCQS